MAFSGSKDRKSQSFRFLNATLAEAFKVHLNGKTGELEEENLPASIKREGDVVVVTFKNPDPETQTETSNWALGHYRTSSQNRAAA